jgi:alpha(1,3/1,4) fucosyltransferase
MVPTRADRPPLRIGYCDFWGSFDSTKFFVTRLLSEHYTVTINNRSPDILFYSVFGARNLGFRGLKVLINGEQHSVSYGRPAFTLGYRDGVDDRTFRLPIWAWNLDEQLLSPSLTRIGDEGSKFANFIYSNRNCEYRNQFFSALNRRIPVDGLGAVHRTLPDQISSRTDAKWRSSKVSILSNYRFTISMENVRQPGYSTEKITDAFLAGSIPIYWGDPFIAQDFDSRTFIDVSSFRTVTEAIDHIIDVETSEAARLEMRSHAPMSREAWDRYSPAAVSKFLKQIPGELPSRRSFRTVAAEGLAGAAYRVARRIAESQSR